MTDWLDPVNSPTVDHGPALKNLSGADGPFHLALICDHRRWLQLLADEWWIPDSDDSGFRLGVERPYTVDCGEKIAVVAWIDPQRLPDIAVPVSRDQEWRLCRLAEARPGDEAVYWNAPIPLAAIAWFSVSTEGDKGRLVSMSKGFANLASLEQPLTVRLVAARADMGPVPNIQVLRPPATWNALRGAAAMAMWSVPSTGPWLDLLCAALSRQANPRNDTDASWWAEPPWRARPATRASNRDIALWRAMLDTFAMRRLRDGWNRQDLLDEIIRRATAEIGDRHAFATLEHDTALLLRDLKTIDVMDGDRDPLGMALQLVLLRPAVERFESWKADLPGMQPSVWLTAATLAGLVTGYRDLEPRFTGLPQGRYWLALRTWHTYSALHEPHAWPGLVDADPHWTAGASMLTICVGESLLAQRRQNSRGRWHLSDLNDKNVRAAAVALVQGLQPALTRLIVRIADSSISWSGNGTVRVSKRRLLVDGEIVLPVSGAVALDHDLDEQGFRRWISHAAIGAHLPDPPAAVAQQPLAETVPRQASLLTEENGHGVLASTGVAGLVAVPMFVTPEEEQQLIDAVDRGVWLEDLARRVQHYGWRYDYRARKLNPDGYLGPLPEWARPLAQRMMAAGLTDEMPDQVIVNEYVGKQGIAAHVDCESCFRGAVVTISLLESWEMEFCNRKTKYKATVLLERGSAIVMQGAARHDWTHEIRKRLKEKWGKRGRRISLTFRKVSVPAGK